MNSNPIPAMKSKMFLKLFVLLGFLFSIQCEAQLQEYLYLKKKNTAKTKSIHINDLILVRSLKEESIKGTLNKVTPEYILVDGLDFSLNEIESIRTYNRFGKVLGRSLIYGGLFFTGIFAANSLIKGYQPILTDGNLVAIGSLLLVGVVLELSAIRTLKMSKGWKIEPVIFPLE